MRLREGTLRDEGESETMDPRRTQTDVARKGPQQCPASHRLSMAPRGWSKETRANKTKYSATHPDVVPLAFDK
ncbi:hypothetical protein Nepgr_033015 [Nepenthes gracilis]|uniref:Uncharacterized protein n=1 Tax=Nepenthes gracilis TaxID=150966 RepID=A0AAD3TLY2_NEPGR|nr:hypothetical protein Nepgr_033015 [Nepenthes gracilis]